MLNKLIAALFAILICQSSKSYSETIDVFQQKDDWAKYLADRWRQTRSAYYFVFEKTERPCSPMLAGLLEFRRGGVAVRLLTPRGAQIEVVPLPSSGNEGASRAIIRDERCAFSIEVSKLVRTADGGWSKAQQAPIRPPMVALPFMFASAPDEDCPSGTGNIVVLEGLLGGELTNPRDSAVETEPLGGSEFESRFSFARPNCRYEMTVGYRIKDDGDVSVRADKRY